MGLPFSCPFAAYTDLENGFESLIIKTIGLDKGTFGKSLIDNEGKERDSQSPRTQDRTMEKITRLPLVDSSNPKHEAAIKLQKVYKSFRTRRKLADCAVLIEQSWWKLLDFAELKHRLISFFDIEKHETAISKWSRARTSAAKVRVTSDTGEVCSCSGNRQDNWVKVVQWLLEIPDSFQLTECDGQMIVNLQTSRKKLEDLKQMLFTDNKAIQKSVVLNAKNCVGYIALDMLDDPFHINSETHKFLPNAGVLGSKGLKYSIRFEKQSKNLKHAILLPMTTLLMAISFFSAMVVLEGSKNPQNHNSTITRWFVWLNSTLFITLDAVNMLLIRDFPWKPWPQIYLLTLFGSYIYFIMMVSTFKTEAWILLFLGIPFLLLLLDLSFHINSETRKFFPNARVLGSEGLKYRIRLEKHGENLKQAVLLPMTTLLMAISFFSAIGVLGGSKKSQNHNSTITHWFVWLNSTLFIALDVVSMLLIRNFPWKPWPQIYLLTLFGSYIYFIMMVSMFKTEAWILLFLGIPFLLLFAARKIFGFKQNTAYFGSQAQDKSANAQTRGYV